MKLLLILAISWGFVCVAVGIVGSEAFRLRQDSSEESSFRSELLAIQQTLAITEWDPPIETDPRWQDLQHAFDVTMVLRDLPVANEKTENATVDKSSRDNSSDPTVVNPRRVDSSIGDSRLEATLPLVTLQLKNGGVRKVSMVVVRRLKQVGNQGLWWLLWSLISLTGVVFAIASVQHVRTVQDSHRRLIEPWLSALRGGSRDANRLLPPLTEYDSELEPPLAIVSEEVNHIVSDLSNANERSDLVLGNLQEGVLAIDDRSQVLLANSALRRHLELADETFLYRPLLEVIRVPTVTELAKRVLKRQAAFEDAFELGSPERSLRLLGRPLPLGKDRHGNERLGALLTVRDETLLRRIESVRRDFVANASHELKTPLAAIRAYAETLQMGALDDREAAERFVGNIIAQADRINSLVQGMLQLSRVQSGGALRIEPFDVSEALESCVAAAEAMARTKSISIDTFVPSSPIELVSDRDGFQTILSNLLSNAVRYTHDAGNVTLRITHDGNWLDICVADSGIGIQQEDLERIFERFYRAEKARSPTSGGTGLGLSIVKNLVNALGGEVSVSSVPLKGSQFRVRLPIRSTS